MLQRFHTLRYPLTTIFCAYSLLLGAGFSHAFEPCRIRIVDDANGWPVPLVELKTTHNVRFVSDNAGVVAFDLPELMNVETWLSVEGHGYSVKKDGFGYAGVRVTPREGETLTIKVHRELPGKRLGRITGGGLFAESQKLGDETDWKEQGILGCDSVQNAIYDGKLFWSWGDTTLPGYPLGRFHMTGATTALQPLKSFEPPVRLRYDYFTDEHGASRDIAKMPGGGPTWLDGFISLPDRTGQERLVATYSKIRNSLTTYEKGLCVWNAEEKKFEKLKTVWKRTDNDPKPPPMPFGHPVLWTNGTGQEWALFGDAFPKVKCHATFEAWADSQQWQTITAPEAPAAANGDKKIKPHRGAIAWNEYRHKWVTIFTQMYGENSAFGELWYAEADAPTGPWEKAVHVVTHNHYTFYNPQIHAGFTPKGSPILLFEATYTHTFSETPCPTPRHDYNQVLYRLDLDEISKPTQPVNKQ